MLRTTLRGDGPLQQLVHPGRRCLELGEGCRGDSTTPTRGPGEVQQTGADPAQREGLRRCSTPRRAGQVSLQPFREGAGDPWLRVSLRGSRSSPRASCKRAGPASAWGTPAIGLAGSGSSWARPEDALPFPRDVPAPLQRRGGSLNRC